MTLPELHHPKKVAAALGVSAWWLKDQARKQRIGAVKVAGSWRFTDDHVAQLIAESEIQPKPEETETTRSRARPHAPGAEQVLTARRPRRARPSTT